ncbi:MAG: carboxymuconolactone decarboxylase family protein [Acidimicrobiales bacterium]
MAHIEPLSRDQLPQYEDQFRLIEGAMGFVPTSLMTMAKVPALMEAFSQLAVTVNVLGHVDGDLVQLVAHVASRAAGCRYCQAHTAAHAAHAGADPDKIEAVWEFETNDLFDDAERAALRVARDGAQVPNAVTAAHFVALREHYSEDQIIQIVAVISLFGYLNRWNDTMATALETVPLGFAEEHLAESGWDAGKHR